jgi:hypothetical protein
MKLSEDIRLGAMTGPQVFGTVSAGSGTCAIGAALVSVGRMDLVVCGWEPLYALWPVLKTLDVTACPQCGNKHSGSMILHLNDGHKWTRERIADFVETVELAQVAKDGEALALVSVSVVSERKS